MLGEIAPPSERQPERLDLSRPGATALSQPAKVSDANMHGGGGGGNMRASDWRPLERNTLRGFFVLHLPSGLVLHDCTLHRKDDREWVGLPGKPQIGADGLPRKDPNTGKPLYTVIVELPDRKVRERFQAAALEAVHALLGERHPGALP